MGTGRPPEPWAMLMAELMVSDFPLSLAFWTGPLGFSVAFERPGLNFACLSRPEGDSWRRVVIEKPFGHDLESARQLNEIVESVFPPDSVFRIDH